MQHYQVYKLEDLKKMYFEEFFWLYEMIGINIAENNIQLLTVIEHQMLAKSEEGIEDFPKLSKEYRKTISKYLKTQEKIKFDKDKLQNIFGNTLGRK